MTTPLAPISIDRLRARLSYCPETGTMTWKPGSGRHCAGKIAGSLDAEGYVKVTFDRRCLRGHRVAWAIHYGYWPEIGIDHINHKKSDNRISNLRLATQSQNNANRGTMRTNTHGDKGVTQLPSGSWQAQIQHNGKNHYLGAFKEKGAAIAAYAAAAVRYFGSFADQGVAHV